MSEQQYDDLTRGRRRRLMLRATLRPALSTASLLLLYYLLPLDEHATGTTVLSLVGGLVLVAVLLTWQVRSIRTAKYPLLRAIEGLAVSLPLFILVFATVYFTTAHNVPFSFSEGLTRTDSLYFAVTVLSTVGFGDIHPVTQGARVLVMIQMIGDLFLFGIVARLIVGAVQTGLRSKETRTRPG